MNTAAAHRRWQLAALVAAVVLLHWMGLQALPAPAWRAPVPGPALRVELRTARAPAPAVAPAPVAAAREATAPPLPRPRSAPASAASAASAAAAAPAAPAAPGAPPASAAAASVATAVTPTPDLLSPPRPPASASAVVLPSPVRLTYDATAQVRGQPAAGSAQLHWRHDGAAYEATLAITGPPPLVTRRQHSTGRLTAEGLAPTRFGERVRGEAAAHFDAAAGRVVFSTNRPDAALLPGMQDRLSVLVQLGAVVAGAPARWERPGAALTVPVAGTREAAEWRFTADGPETLALPGGTVVTLRFVRLPQGEYEPRLELWLAPGQDYAPVRLRLTQPNGDWLDLQWSATDRG